MRTGMTAAYHQAALTSYCVCSEIN